MFTVKDHQVVFDPNSTNTLLDAALVSLLSRRRVNPDELQNHHTDQGGYWGDLIDNTSLGSKLWTHDREVQSEGLAEIMKKHVIEGLQWMKEDGFIDQIEVSSSIKGEKVLLTIALDTNEFSIEV